MRNTFNFHVLILVSTLFLSGFGAIGTNSVPRLINYQGKLTDASGNVLPNGSYGIALRIWTKPSASESGDQLVWGQEYSVAVVHGLFNVMLGAPGIGSFTNAITVDLASAFSDANRFLGITLTKGTNGAAIANASEIVPRQQLLSTPYAFEALNVVNSPIPRGVVVMWNASISSIPPGWALCDGQNGTPDLRDRFVVGARQDVTAVAMTAIKGSLMQTGGTHQVALTSEQMPPHSHAYEKADFGGKFDDYDEWAVFQKNVSSQTGSTGGVDGSALPHENTPPFYALAFIMKL
jgi:microcystin-dependent protein